MVARRPISLRLDEATLAEIDRQVAAAPPLPYLDRTEWIRRAIAEKIARANDPEMVAVPPRPPAPILPPLAHRFATPSRPRDVTPIPKSPTR